MLFMVIAILAADYKKTLNLRHRIGKLQAGSSADDIVRLLGQPDAIWTGSRYDESSGELMDGYEIWKYCSRFDWDGQRSRWNDAPFVPYWLSRLDPSKNESHDSVIELWIRNGKLEVVENAVIENLIGRHPTLSI
jgi:hypothetical protein